MASLSSHVGQTSASSQDRPEGQVPSPVVGTIPTLSNPGGEHENA